MHHLTSKSENRSVIATEPFSPVTYVAQRSSNVIASRRALNVNAEVDLLVTVYIVQ